ncbi:MAG TPA: hypothetical protein PJ994_07520 [Tepidiformaceae bacterium]|nr:hypothetical protein [Tepidiformaceae bacterium]HMO94706.1 hypothetical protein [Tepidiformaceae bacterium]
MSGESFERRVEILRDSWAERRQLKGLASVHDFESQFALLNTLHGWAEAAATDIRKVYGESLMVTISSIPGRDDSVPAFAVTIGHSHTVTFVLTERRRMNGSRWFISVTVGAGGPGGALVAAGPERRNGQWTRGRLEDILLSVLGAYERALSDGSKPPGTVFKARGA